MKNELETIGREMPYRFPDERFDCLREKIRNRIAEREAPPVARFSLRRVGLAAAAAVVLGFVATVFFVERRDLSAAPAADVTQLLKTASDETVIQAAAENYDDILVNQQL